MTGTGIPQPCKFPLSLKKWHLCALMLVLGEFYHHTPICFSNSSFSSPPKQIFQFGQIWYRHIHWISVLTLSCSRNRSFNNNVLFLSASSNRNAVFFKYVSRESVNQSLPATEEYLIGCQSLCISLRSHSFKMLIPFNSSVHVFDFVFNEMSTLLLLQNHSCKSQ